MSLRLLYLIMVRGFGWLLLLGRSQASKDHLRAACEMHVTLCPPRRLTGSSDGIRMECARASGRVYRWRCERIGCASGLGWRIPARLRCRPVREQERGVNDDTADKRTNGFWREPGICRVAGCGVASRRPGGRPGEAVAADRVGCRAGGGGLRAAAGCSAAAVRPAAARPGPAAPFVYVADKSNDVISQFGVLRGSGAHPRQGHRWNDHRVVIDGVFHRVRTGCPWRDLPERFGNWKTVYNRHRRWSGDRTSEKILDRLRAGCDEAAGRAWAVAVDATVAGRTSTRPGPGMRRPPMSNLARLAPAVLSAAARIRGCPPRTSSATSSSGLSASSASTAPSPPATTNATSCGAEPSTWPRSGSGSATRPMIYGTRSSACIAPTRNWSSRPASLTRPCRRRSGIPRKS